MDQRRESRDLNWQLIETITNHRGQFLFAQDLGNGHRRYGVGFVDRDGSWSDMSSGAWVEGVTHWAEIHPPEIRYSLLDDTQRATA